MKRAVLEFPQANAAEDVSIDVLNTLADLRSDLLYIEQAIRAVERIAVAQMGEDARSAPKAVSRNTRGTPGARRKNRAGGLRRSQLTLVGRTL